MKRSAKKLLALLVLSGLLLLILAGAAVAAPPWSDAPASWWSSNYGVTETQVATVADGYPDGTFRPAQAVTRGQFAKMAVSGLGVHTADPAKATFVDVIPSNPMFPYVEGAYASGLILGYPVGNQLYFKPTQKIQRQHANSILGRYLSQLELDITGAIHGDVRDYGSLDEWYAAESKFYLDTFTDAKHVGSAHRAPTAYLIFRDIVKGSNGRLNPTAPLNRAQAAALILRVEAEAQAIKTPPPPPTNLGVVATGSGVSVSYNSAIKQYLGNDPTPQVTGDTLAGRPIAVYDNGVKLIEDASNSAGKFYADLSTSLADGTHSFTAKVKNANGLVSPASLPVTYVLDTVSPTAAVTKPEVPAGASAVVLGQGKPEFTASAGDERSGVKQVVFQCSVKQTSPSWQTISIRYAPEAGSTGTYAAEWPTTGTLGTGLANGEYLFRVVVTDNAGNVSTSPPVEVIIDASPPVLMVTGPYQGQLLQEGQPADITWDLLDQSELTTVSIEYTLDYSVPSPHWETIDQWAPNTGRYTWMTPDIAGDKQHVRVRITAVDKAGHTAVALSSEFTIYDLPAPVSNLTAADNDSTNSGIDGRDFSASWTPSTSPDVVTQQVYILPASIVAPDFGSSAYAPVDTVGPSASSWTGTQTLTSDSDQVALGSGAYKIWVVVTDIGGHMASPTAAELTVTAEP